MWKACMNEQHLLSKLQCSAWEHGLCSLYCSWPCSSATWHNYHFGSLHDHRFYSSYKQVQKCERSSFAQSAEFTQFVVDDVNQILSFLGALTHSMELVILQTFTTLWGDLNLNCENGWATSCWLYVALQFRYMFCGVRLTEIRNTEVYHCIDPTASDLEWQVSFLHSWSLKKQAVHRGSHSGQCAACLMSW